MAWLPRIAWAKGVAFALLPLMLGGCFSAAIPDRKVTVAETPKPSLPPPVVTASAAVREHQRIVAAYNGIYEDPRLDTLIRDTVDKLVSASERPDQRYRITVLNSPAINAFALPSGEDFPYRDLILFVSFGVIFITLVGLGLGLPAVVRWLGVAQAGRDEHIAEHESEIAARREALDAALKSLDAITDDRELSDEVVKLLRSRHEIRANQLPDSLDPDKHDVSATGTALTRELISAERKFIHMLLRDGKITDEIRRRIERDLDLEEASLANREYRKGPL